MTTERREAIDRLEKLVRLRKSKNTIKYDNCICSTEDLDIVLSLIKEQDKQIDLMAEKIHQLGSDYDDFCIDIIWNEDCDEDCKDCIKQYFAGLVEKGNS